MFEEFTQVPGYHRKSAIRLLGGAQRDREPSGRGRPCAYGPEVAHSLKGVWEVSSRLCSKRLKPFLPELLEVLERQGELALEPKRKEQLLGHECLHHRPAAAALSPPSQGAFFQHHQAGDTAQERHSYPHFFGVG